MNRDQIIAGFFFILFLFVLYQLFLIFSPFFKSVFWAGILAFVFYPLHKKLLKLTGNRSTVASVISTLLVLIVVLPIAGFIIYSIIVEGAKLYDLASETFTTANIKEFLNYLRNLEPISKILDTVFKYEELQSNLTAYLLGSAKFIGNYATGLLAEATKNVLIIFVHVLLVIFLIFFFFADGGKMVDYIKEVLPMERKHKNAVVDKISETLSAVIRGQFMTAFIQGGVAGFMFWILGLPIPLFFGFMTFLSAMIPVTGAATVWVPFVIYLLSIKAYTKAVILLIVGTFIISLIDNILKPYLIGSKTKLPIILLFFGILGGLHLYGFTGIFMGPVILALFFALVKIYQMEYMGMKNS